MLEAFKDAHTEAQHKLHAFLLGDASEASAEVKFVNYESKLCLAKAHMVLSNLRIEDSVLQTLHTKQTIRVVLHAQEQLIEDLEAEGILTEKEAHGFYKIIRTNFRKIKFSANILDDDFDLECQHSNHGYEFGLRRMSVDISAAFYERGIVNLVNPEELQISRQASANDGNEDSQVSASDKKMAISRQNSHGDAFKEASTKENDELDV